VRISFGRENPAGTPKYEVHVYLSYPEAKILMRFLQNSIQNYESLTKTVIPDLAGEQNA